MDWSSEVIVEMMTEQIMQLQEVWVLGKIFNYISLTFDNHLYWGYLLKKLHQCNANEYLQHLFLMKIHVKCSFLLLFTNKLERNLVYSVLSTWNLCNSPPTVPLKEMIQLADFHKGSAIWKTKKSTDQIITLHMYLIAGLGSLIWCVPDWW